MKLHSGLKTCLILSGIILLIPNHAYTANVRLEPVPTLIVAMLISAPIRYYMIKNDAQADADMLTKAHKAISQIHQEYDYVFDLLKQDSKNLALSSDKQNQLINAIPNSIDSLSNQEDILNKRLVRAQNSYFIRQDSATLKQVEATQHECQELIKRLRALLYNLQISSVAVSKEQDAIA